MHIQRIKSIIHSLKDIIDTEINLLDENGYIFHSTDTNKIGNYDNQIISFELNDGFLIEKQEYIYCSYNSYEEDKCILSIKGINEDTQKFAKMIGIFLGTDIKNISRNDFIKSILLNTISDDSIKNVCEKHHIVTQGQVQIIVIEATENLMGTVEEILSALLSDEIIRIKSKYFAVIKRITDKNNDFPTFLSETISSELLYEVKIGIGVIVDDVYDWHFSYKTAENFIEIGKVFLPSHKTYSFKSLTIPLMISKIQANDLEEIMKQFDCNIKSLFSNNELLNTAFIFFKNNLNISDTARDLFVHRNTLIYRLSKIQDITGYDLRIFEDAILFNVMINGHLCLTNENKSIIK
ncbi:transcriptional regulator, CdaR [Alkaliphilus metalliredigens QYMF]|uniref:Transcriptional regulator, CdaR n=1 Tax=Alkaliphilus metalliredigens (strain QYMF) TaxID=293826 RepID=A6TTD4_ALKMQ|nr:helix-turn-helix domain-containing protein [Alkaliphilus metalliredigens]ABR49452.1 transcriptional regulator, CdaR [Alkaliphilus metalliredigens QYMF]